MSNLTHLRCFNHAQREAAARCPECRQFFCRECITEHDDRIICAGCLKKEQKVATSSRRPLFLGVARVFLCFIALMGLWFFFFSVGDMLLSLPTSFHENSVWQTHPLDN